MDKEELSWRKKAVKLFLRGLRPKEILKRIPRARIWLFRWLKRFQQEGWPGLINRSTQPHLSPHAYPAAAQRVVLRVRRTLEQRQIGLIGARAIRHEILDHRLLNPVPSLATINRWLKAAGAIKSAPLLR